MVQPIGDPIPVIPNLSKNQGGKGSGLNFGDLTGNLISGVNVMKSAFFGGAGALFGKAQNFSRLRLSHTVKGNKKVKRRRLWPTKFRKFFQWRHQVWR